MFSLLHNLSELSTVVSPFPAFNFSVSLTPFAAPHDHHHEHERASLLRQSVFMPKKRPLTDRESTSKMLVPTTIQQPRQQSAKTPSSRCSKIFICKSAIIAVARHRDGNMVTRSQKTLSRKSHWRDPSLRTIIIKHKKN